MSTCPECEKVFSRKKNMKRHFSTQHGKEEYICITFYFCKDKLKQHVKKHEKLSTNSSDALSTVTDSLSSHANEGQIGIAWPSSSC